MIEVLLKASAMLIPIVGAMVRHYGRKAEAERAEMRANIKALMERQVEQCQTARKAYKLLREEQEVLRAQISQK